MVDGTTQLVDVRNKKNNTYRRKYIGPFVQSISKWSIIITIIAVYFPIPKVIPGIFMEVISTNKYTVYKILDEKYLKLLHIGYRTYCGKL